MAGVLFREDLRQIVLDRVAGKVWLYHPVAGTAPPVPGHAPAAVPACSNSAHGERRRRKAEGGDALNPGRGGGGLYLDAVRELALIDYEIDKDELLDPARER